jgi:hypothetical protein
MEALAPMDDAIARVAGPVDLTVEAAKGQARPPTASCSSGATCPRRTTPTTAIPIRSSSTGPARSAWTPGSSACVDGLLVRVVVPAGGSPMLHFVTAALEADIDLSQLPARIGGAQRLADDEEGLVWLGPAFGALRGVVSDDDGVRIGHLRGLWGHAPKRDADVWFAKYIGDGGEARGLAFGKYGAGVFGGLWAAKDETDVSVGSVEGFYSDGYDANDGRGVRLGRWSEKCQ